MRNGLMLNVKISLFTCLFCLLTPTLRAESEADNCFGIKVEDPYRYLEDSGDPETKQWLFSQETLTSNYLGKLPERDLIRSKLETFWNYQRMEGFSKTEHFYFFSMRKGLENQPVYYRAQHIGDEPEVIVNPNEMAEDGTVSLVFSCLSGDGEWLAMGLAQNDSDWLEIRVRNIETKEDLTDRIQWVKLSVDSCFAWHPKGDGFYYCRFEEPLGHPLTAANECNQIYYHKLGTPQIEDLLIYASPPGQHQLLEPCIDVEEKYLLIKICDGCDGNEAFLYQEIGSEAPPKPMFFDFDAHYTYLDNNGSEFWFLTDLDAPLQRVISIDLHEKTIKEIIPEKDKFLLSVSKKKDRLIASYFQDASSLVELLHLDGTFDRKLDLPPFGKASNFFQGESEKELYYSFCSFIQPAALYCYDFETNTSRIILDSKLPVSTKVFETKQIFVQSPDGTQIPVFLSYKKGEPLTNRRVCLYGYGGFSIAVAPFFSPEKLAWMDLGGVFAVANLRGGSEYGTSWHKAGMLQNKQNVFDDFIAVAASLIEEGITTRAKLAIEGRSNGGLLVGACLTQRPDLFGAALPIVGVLDMLRFHKFTEGAYWMVEYGSPDHPDHFPFLYAYSPLHRIQTGSFPPTLIITADHDDRVVPAHSYKFAVALQQAQTGQAPILLQVGKSTGHGLGKPVSKWIDEGVDRLAFLLDATK